MIIGKTQRTVKFNRPARLDWLLAAAVAAGAFVIYLRTLAPDILPGDAGEFQLAAWRLGLAHPTGYPLYMLLGSLWQHALALFGVNPAAALNSLSALFAALAVAATYLLLLDAPVASPLTRRLVALFTASLLAVSATYWSQALIAEVYTLHALFLLLLLLVLQRAAASNANMRRILFWTALIFGLSLAHHAMTLLAAPAVLIYLFVVDRTWWRMPLRAWLAITGALFLPLLLYAYIPLRSGPGASPWYHQPLGESTLSLYAGDFASFVDFLSGRSISVGFHSLDQALANLSGAVNLWRAEFGILGLILVGLGVYVLAERRRPFLWLTAGIAIAQQLFNLFYAIGDIGVYYIPLYVIGVIWAGYGAAGLCDGMLMRMGHSPSGDDDADAGWGNAGALIALVLFLLPISAFSENSPSVDQSQNRAARDLWQPVVDALAPGDAILVSNDRDEIPPLFYLQYVERSAPAATALHPLMAPDARFRDLGATIDTALREGEGAPVYLIKPMPGLEVEFDLESAPGLLVGVTKKENVEPAYAVDYPLGGLMLLGYDWHPDGDEISVRLHWRVDQPLHADYTTSVQLFDAGENRVAQSDERARRPLLSHLPLEARRAPCRGAHPHPGHAPARSRILGSRWRLGTHRRRPYSPGRHVRRP